MGGLEIRNLWELWVPNFDIAWDFNYLAWYKKDRMREREMLFFIFLTLKKDKLLQPLDSKFLFHRIKNLPLLPPNSFFFFLIFLLISKIHYFIKNIYIIFFYSILNVEFGLDPLRFPASPLVLSDACTWRIYTPFFFIYAPSISSIFIFVFLFFLSLINCDFVKGIVLCLDKYEGF